MLWLFSVICTLSASFTNANTILVHGDSLSAGYGVAPEKTWVALLEQTLPTQYRVINASISGETSKGGADRLPALLDEYKPEIVVLELGANDGLRGYPLGQLESNLRQMIEQAQQADAEVVILGIRLPPNFGKRYTEPFFSLYSDLANRYNTAYLPFLLEGVAQYSELMQSDGLHPTEEAQPLIRDNVLPILEPLLQ